MLMATRRQDYNPDSSTEGIYVLERVMLSRQAVSRVLCVGIDTKRHQTKSMASCYCGPRSVVDMRQAKQEWIFLPVGIALELF